MSPLCAEVNQFTQDQVEVAAVEFEAAGPEVDGRAVCNNHVSWISQIQGN